MVDLVMIPCRLLLGISGGLLEGPWAVLTCLLI